MAVAGVLLAAALALISSRPQPSPEDGSGVGHAPARPTQPREMVSSPTPMHDLAAWQERIRRASLADLGSLMHEALALSDDALRRQVLRELTAAWIQGDPSGFNTFFAALEVRGDPVAMARVVAAVGAVLAGLDPAVAASPELRALVQRLIPNIVGEDPQAALRWATDWLPEHAREAAMVPIAREIARRDVRAGLDLLPRIASPLRRMQATAAIGSVWAATDPRGAIAWAGDLPRRTERAMTLNAVVLAVAPQDPTLAAETLLAADQRLGAENRAQRAADLERLGLTERDLVNDPAAYDELIEGGALLPPESADSELLSDAARVTATRLAELDPNVALAFADAIENSFLARKTRAGALAGWATTDPAGAVDHFQQRAPGSVESVAPIFESWAALDPAGAAQGVQRLDDPEARAVALDTVMGTWAAADPVAAAHHLDTLAEFQRSDRAVSAVVQALSAVAPEEAWNRAQAIRDPGVRNRAMKSAFAVLAVDQPEAARVLLASTALAPTQAERFEEMLRAVSGTP